MINLEMVKVNIFIIMGTGMRDNIKVIWKKVEEDFFIPMEKFILGIDVRIRNKDLDRIFTKMGKFIKVFWKIKIFKFDKISLKKLN